jgi:hypothetical protein
MKEMRVFGNVGCSVEYEVINLHCARLLFVKDSIRQFIEIFHNNEGIHLRLANIVSVDDLSLHDIIEDRFIRFKVTHGPLEGVLLTSTDEGIEVEHTRDYPLNLPEGSPYRGFVMDEGYQYDFNGVKVQVGATYEHNRDGRLMAFGGLRISIGGTVPEVTFVTENKLVDEFLQDETI